MAKFIRYSLATVCCATSVGCLALWWRSYSYADKLTGHSPSKQAIVGVESRLGLFKGICLTVDGSAGPRMRLRHNSERVDDESRHLHVKLVDAGSFSLGSNSIFFPLWYPALIFALAGAAALRFRRRFSIRSALVTVSVVAALLGMAVTL